MKFISLKSTWLGEDKHNEQATHFNHNKEFVPIWLPSLPQSMML